VRILAVSDEVSSLLYTPTARGWLGKIDLILGCGDLPYYYLEYLMNLLDAPLCYVHGNHDPLVEYSNAGGTKTAPEGGDNVDRRCVKVAGLLVVGLEGCIRYRPDGLHQFTQNEMTLRSLALLPKLARNRLVRGRWLDVLIAHSPPRGIHDMPTAAHTGFQVFLDLMRIFRPRYLLHGHRHQNYAAGPAETLCGATMVINVHPYRVLEIEANR
jgi:Icc-related predicted phosphoesterase